MKAPTDAPIDPGPQLPAAVTDQAGARSPLESVALVIILLVLTIAAIVVLVRWRPAKHRWALIAVSVVLGVATIAAGVNSYVGYVRSFNDFGRLLLIVTGGNDGDEGGGAVQVVASPQAGHSGVRVADLWVPDPRLGVNSGRTRVLLPPGYDDPAEAGRRYPVVYLVHGYPSGGPDDWLGSGAAIQTLQALVDTHAADPMIVVAVDATAGSGDDWECLNVPGGPQLESYLTSTVVNAVDARFRTLPDRGDRAIGGMSGGAFCSLNLGLHHQDLYSVVLLTEPYDDPGSAGASLLAGHPDLLWANTPRRYLPTLRLIRPFAVMLHAGVIAHSDVRLAYQLGEQLSALGAHVAVREEPGEWHTWRTARIALPYLLAFASQNFLGGHAMHSLH